MKGYEYKTDFAERFVALSRTQREFILEFFQRFTEGRIEQAGRSLLIVLRARGISVPDAARERILAQRDLDRLERWLEKAVVVASVTAVLDEPN